MTGVRKQWNPLDVFWGRSDRSFAMVILNQPLESFADVVLGLWGKASLRVTTDGGTNHLYAMLESRNISFDDNLPDLITGDFDSIDPELLEFYKEKGSMIINTPDQDYTDFTKSLQQVVEVSTIRKLKVDYIVVAVDTSGRFDHIMANIQTLYLIRKWTEVPVFILSQRSLTWLLREGVHEIAVDKSLEGTCCGLLPIGEPCRRVTTTGLKWNLTDDWMQFGGLISTSNTYDGSPVVTIETDKPLVWTMEVKSA